MKLQNGYKLKVKEHERYNPREDDNLSIIVASHRRYDFQDDNAPKVQFSDFGSWAEVQEHLEQEHGAVHVKPLYLYDHGGQSISTRSFVGRSHHGEWDSGQVGLVFTTKERIGVIGTPEDRIDAVIEAEIEEYDKYIQGQPYYTAKIKNAEGTEVAYMEFDDEDEALPWAEALIETWAEFRGLVEEKIIDEY